MNNVVMNMVKKATPLLASTALISFSSLIHAFTPAQQPLCLSASKKPMTMLVLGRDHTIYYEAYNDATDLDGDGLLDVGFKPSINYYGYFNSNTCYDYSSGIFKPKDKAGSDGCSSVGGSWHGNFMNYLSMSRLDVMRQVLYGGKRVEDQLTKTVLERAYIPRDSHSWARQYPTRGKTASEMPYKIQDYTGLPAVANGKYHLFASVKKQLWVRQNADPNVNNGTAMDWASQERKGPGYAGILSPEPSQVSGGSWYDIKVEVCDVAHGEEGFCKEYNGNYKPVGVLQTVGIDKAMPMGLLTGSYYGNLQGGVIKKNVLAVDDEVNQSTGQFLRPSHSIVDSIDDFSIKNFWHPKDPSFANYQTEYGCWWVGEEPGEDQGMRNGKCIDWGNPIGEMLYESMRYFSGEQFPRSAFNDGSGPSWKDPFLQGQTTVDECLIPYNLILSDPYPSYDADQVPGNAFTSYANSGGPQLNVSDMLDIISSNEGISGNSYFIGELQGQSDAKYNPTSKVVSSLSKVRGLAPFNAGEQGSYSSAGVAYWGRITDMRSDISGAQNIHTLAVALASPLPEFNFDINGQSVRVIPFAKSTRGTMNHADGRWLDIHPTEAFQPTNAILDFYVLEQNSQGVPTKVRVSFDDVTQGGDHDLDAIVEYQFLTAANNGEADPKDISSTLALADNELRIDTSIVYSGGADMITQHLGYIIDGTSQMHSHLQTGMLRDATEVSYTTETVTDNYVDIVASGSQPRSICWAGEANGWSPNGAMLWSEDLKGGAWFSYADFSVDTSASDGFKITPDCSWNGTEYGLNGGSTNASIPERGRILISVTPAQLSAKSYSVELISSTIEVTNLIFAQPDGTIVLHDSSVNKYYLLEDYDGHLEVDLQATSSTDYTLYEIESEALVELSPSITGSSLSSSLSPFKFSYEANANVLNLSKIASYDNSLAYDDYSKRVSDGVYLEVSDQGYGSNTSPQVSYYLDTFAGEHAYPHNRRYSVDHKLGHSNSRTFIVGDAAGGSSSILRSPLWYAAKWGSFIEEEGGDKVPTGTEWDEDGDGEPDTYWLVSNPSTLVDSLKAAFELIDARSGISDTGFALNAGNIGVDSMIFSATYESKTWSGDVIGVSIAAEDNEISIKDVSWSVRKAMAAQFDSAAKVAQRLVLTKHPFVSSDNLTAAFFEDNVMKSYIAQLRGDSNKNAAKFVNYIRGDNTYEADGTFRERKVTLVEGEDAVPYVLGDVVNSEPVSSTSPSLGYNSASYRQFAADFKNRTPILIFGANDGMVHVVNASKDGANAAQELFAYIPSQMYRTDASGDVYLAQLSKPSFNKSHTFFVDGPIKVTDVEGNRGDGKQWHTIAIGGLGGGGKGYYALDISDPDPTDEDALTGSANRFIGKSTTPVMWEKTDMGYIYSKAQVGEIEHGGLKKWVALLPNGYGDSHRNTPHLFVVDALDGSVLLSFDTAQDSSCTATGGLSKVTPVTVDGLIKYAYAGDLNGNLWRFNFEDNSVNCVFTALDDNGDSQAITAAPMVGSAPYGVSDAYMVYFGTGKYIEESDKANTQQQAVYAILDKLSANKVDMTSLQEMTVSESGTVRKVTGDSIDYSSSSAKSGFYFILPASKERIVTDPKLFDGKLYISSLMLTEEACVSACPSFGFELSLFSGQGYAEMYERAATPSFMLHRECHLDYCESGSFVKITPEKQECEGVYCDELDPQKPNIPYDPVCPKGSPACTPEPPKLKDKVEGVDIKVLDNNKDGIKSWRHLY